jgi:D-alanyl-D-alanine carboxypeptidase
MDALAVLERAIGGSAVRRQWTRAVLVAACSTALQAACWAEDAARESSEYPATVYLKGLPREWSGTSDHDCKTYEDKNIDKLSKPFAQSAARFLKAFVEVHGAVTITSAYRSEEEQTCVCIGEKGPCAGRPHVLRRKKHRPIVVRSVSHHQLGIALDVRAGTGSEEEFICMHEFAELNPQFGVQFPFGKRDYPHMEPGTSRPLKMASLASADPVVTPCRRMKIMLTDEPVD